MFEPRDYQKTFCDAVKNGEKKRFMAVWPRRAGKDLTAINICLEELRKPNSCVQYICPTFSSGCRGVWHMLGELIVEDADDFFLNCWTKANQKHMKITCVNGSVFQVFGSDNKIKCTDDKTKCGLKPTVIVISEPALCDPRIFEQLDTHDAKVILLGTPHRPKEGTYWFKVLYKKALANKDEWFVSHLTIDDTKHIYRKDIEKELKEGLYSQELIDEEFSTIFK